MGLASWILPQGSIAFPRLQIKGRGKIRDNEMANPS